MSNVVTSKTPPKTQLPARFFRNDVAYKSITGLGTHGIVNCGFLLKPRDTGSIRNRVRPNFVGAYVLRGTGLFRDWRGEFRLSPGDFAQMPPGKAHTLIPDSDGQWAECFIGLDARFFETLAALDNIDGETPVLNAGLHLHVALQFEEILRTLQKTQGVAPPQLLVAAHALMVELNRLHRRQKSPDAHAQMVEDAARQLSEKQDQRLDVRALARSFNLSYERFRKIFRERMGTSPGEYRIRRRIDRARTLLIQEGMTNKQAAYALGYPDPYTFSKQFKQVVGVSPSQFRKQ